MGCYGAVTALRNAYHIVRSQPDARVLVITTELSTLHLQPDDALEPLLAMLLSLLPMSAGASPFVRYVLEHGGV